MINALYSQPTLSNKIANLHTKVNQVRIHRSQVAHPNIFPKVSSTPISDSSTETKLNNTISFEDAPLDIRIRLGRGTQEKVIIAKIAMLKNVLQNLVLLHDDSYNNFSQEGNISSSSGTQAKISLRDNTFPIDQVKSPTIIVSTNETPNMLINLIANLLLHLEGLHSICRNGSKHMLCKGNASSLVQNLSLPQTKP